MRFILECDAESPRAVALLGWYQSLGLRERWLEVRAWTKESTLRDLREGGWRTTLALKAHPRTRRRHHAYKGHPAPDPAEVLPGHHRAWGGAGNVVWQALLEDDSAGVSFPQELLAAPVSTRAEWLARLEAYLGEAREEWSRWHDGPVWGLAGFGGSAHAYARAGMQALMVERANDDCDDLQTGLAFARGAARQHGIDWGVDLSLWWGPIHGCIEQMPAHYHVQVLLASWAAGATHYRLEGGDLWLDAAGKPTRIARELGPVIQFIDRLGPCDPSPAIAVVLPRDHAFMTGSAYDPAPVIGSYAKLRPDLPSHQIAAFFNEAFPGCTQERDPFPFGAYEVDDPPASPFALSCVTPRFSPRASDVHSARPTLPFGRFRSRDEAREWMLATGANPADYRALATTQWVDPIDVLTDDVLDSAAGAALLARYTEATLLGDIAMDDGRREVLRDAIHRGLNVTWHVGTFGPADAGLTGITLRGDLGTSQRVEHSGGHALESCMSFTDPVRFAKVERLAKKTNVIRRAMGEEPVVVCRAIGKGLLTSTLLPWGAGTDEWFLGDAQLGMNRGMLEAADLHTLSGHALLLCRAHVRDGEVLWVAANIESAPWLDEWSLALPSDDEEPLDEPLALGPHATVVLRPGPEGEPPEELLRFE